MADYAISNVPRRVVFAASGVGPYAFTFEILAQTDIAVYKDDTLLTLTTDYTVTINSNGTGSITLVTAPTGATQIAIVGARNIQRTTDFTTGGDFFANTVNDELDSLTIFAQQNAEGLSRALVAPQTDPTTVNMILPRKADRAGKYLVFDTNGNPAPGEIPPEVTVVSDNIATITSVANNATNINAVAGQISPVNNIATVASNVASIAAVAGNISNVNTVAGISADVTAVVADEVDIGIVAANIADVNTVASNISDVNTVAGIAADVTAVAADATDIGTVATNIANVNAVGTNIANVNTVAGIDTEITTLAGKTTEIDALYAEIDDIGTKVTKTSDTGAAIMPAGTEAQRPTPVAGHLRFNTDTDEFEGYNGTAWASVGGSAISNDTTTASDLYPAFLNATSGTAANIYTSNAKLLYKPSTGEFKSPELVATNGIVVNSQTVTADYTIPSGSNAMSAGAVAVANGVTVTVSSGSVWTIV